eukprot:6656090-Pyramimonas_sp.AAC.1
MGAVGINVSTCSPTFGSCRLHRGLWLPDDREWRRDRPVPMPAAFSGPAAVSRECWQGCVDDFDDVEVVPRAIAAVSQGTVGHFQHTMRESYRRN